MRNENMDLEFKKYVDNVDIDLNRKISTYIYCLFIIANLIIGIYRLELDLILIINLLFIWVGVLGVKLDAVHHTLKLIDKALEYHIKKFENEK